MPPTVGQGHNKAIIVSYDAVLATGTVVVAWSLSLSVVC